MISDVCMGVLAQESMKNFVDSCDCHDTNEVADALIKLIGLCSLTVRLTVGQDEALSRLIGVVDYISSTESDQRSRKDFLQ